MTFYDYYTGMLEKYETWEMESKNKHVCQTVLVVECELGVVWEHALLQVMKSHDTPVTEIQKSTLMQWHHKNTIIGTTETEIETLMSCYLWC